MNKAQQNRFELLHQQHVNALHRQGKSDRTIDGYSRAVRRIAHFFDCCPDQLTEQQLKDYFTALVHSHFWSTVKVDRCGLQFFYKHVLNKEWVWVDIVKPPRQTTLPDILSVGEIERVINGTQELRYQVFILAAYSMGLRLGVRSDRGLRARWQRPAGFAVSVSLPPPRRHQQPKHPER